MTVPAFPQAPGQPTGQPAAPQIVRGVDGQLYAQTPQGLIPVQVSAQPGIGDPRNQPVATPPAPQPQPQPQQQQQPSNQAPVFNATPDTVIRGTGFPAWMQGRTVSEVTRMVDAMKDGYIRDQQARGNQQQQQQQQQPVTQPASAPNGQPMDARTFYQDPVTNTRRIVEESIRATLGPMLQPLVQQSAVSQVQQMQAEFLRSYPDAAQYMEAMKPHLAALAPEQLVKPETWNAVYRYVLGEAVLARQSAALAPGYNPPPSPPPSYEQPMRVTPQGMFFSESSTPSPASFGQQPTVSAANLSPAELATARMSGMTPEAYAAAKADIMAGKMPVFNQSANGGSNVRQW